MTREDVKRGYALLEEQDRIKKRIERLDDMIGHERECLKEGTAHGVICYKTCMRIETPKRVYPDGAVFELKTISVVELLQTEKDQLECELRKLEDELKGL